MIKRIGKCGVGKRKHRGFCQRACSVFEAAAKTSFGQAFGVGPQMTSRGRSNTDPTPHANHMLPTSQLQHSTTPEETIKSLHDCVFSTLARPNLPPARRTMTSRITKTRTSWHALHPSRKLRSRLFLCRNSRIEECWQTQLGPSDRCRTLQPRGMTSAASEAPS